MGISIALPNRVKQILNRLESKGYEAYVVGGCVRDSLVGKEPHDWDICTNAKPEETQGLFKNCYMIGAEYGTVVVKIDGEDFEVTTYRTDGEYTDGRKPNSVEFTDKLVADIARRDLTINGLAYNETRGLVDYTGGLEDIKERKIKFIGNAEQRMSEDYLRTIRALRFELVLGGFELDKETKELCKTAFKENYKKLSVERIQSEINKVLLKEDLNDIDKLMEFFELMADTIIPELKPIVRLDQKNKYHCYDAFEHTMHVIAGTKPLLETRWAALLHDIGKAQAMTIDECGCGHFVGHPVISTELAEIVLTNMKVSNKFKDTVLELVKYHDSFKDGNVKNAKLRKFMSGRTSEFIDMLLDLQLSDTIAHTNNEGLLSDREVLLEKVRQIQADGSAITLKEMRVNGNGLVEIIGMPKSHIIKEVLEWLLHCCHSYPANNNREWLLSEAARHYKKLKKSN